MDSKNVNFTNDNHFTSAQTSYQNIRFMYREGSSKVLISGSDNRQSHRPVQLKRSKSSSIRNIKDYNRKNVPKTALSPSRRSAEKRVLSDAKMKYYDRVEDSRALADQARQLQYHTQGLVKSAKKQRSNSAKQGSKHMSRVDSSAFDTENRGILLNQKTTPTNRDMILSPKCALRPMRTDAFLQAELDTIMTQTAAPLLKGGYSEKVGRRSSAKC